MQPISQLLSSLAHPSRTTPATSNALSAFVERSATSKSAYAANALTMIPSPPLTREIILAGVAVIEVNFGARVGNEKIALLAEHLLRGDWSAERFARTLAWFIETKKWPAWTIADWYEHRVEIGNYHWAIERWQRREQSQAWMLPGGMIAYTAAGEELPFEKLKLFGR